MPSDLDQKKIDLVNKMIVLSAYQAELKVLQAAEAATPQTAAVRAKEAEIRDLVTAINALHKELLG